MSDLTLQTLGPLDNAPPARGSESTRAAESDAAALGRLRAFLDDSHLKAGDKLPPERLLGPRLGLRRAELRRALEVLVGEGLLWRHVGKGTFLARDPAQSAQSDLECLARRISPADAMRARAAIEPVIAREAAFHAASAAIASLRLTASRQRAATSWRDYEALDIDLHRQIAQASGSVALLAVFDQLNALRRLVVVGRTRRDAHCPPAGHPSFDEHDTIIDALERCDPEGAEQAMRRHLRSVGARIEG